MMEGVRLECGVCRRQFLALAAGSSIGAALAACGPGLVPKPSPPAPSGDSKATIVPKPEDASQVIVQHPEQFSALPLYMVREKRFDSENGIVLDNRQYGVGGDLTAIKTIIAGETHVVLSNPSSVLAARAGGAPIKIIAITSTGALWALAFRTDRGINTTRDLVGKAIAISSPGSLPHVIGRALLMKDGVDEASVTWVAVGGNSDRVKALLVGKVDGAVVPVDTYPQLTADPNIKLIRLQEVLPDYLSGVYVTTDEWIAQRPALLNAFMKAELQGARHVASHRDDSLEVAAKALKMSADQAGPIYDEYRSVWAVNGFVRNEAVQYMLDLNVRFKIQDRSFPLNEVLDWQFAETAVQALGLVRSSN